jgi:hypothetical protein
MCSKKGPSPVTSKRRFWVSRMPLVITAIRKSGARDSNNSRAPGMDVVAFLQVMQVAGTENRRIPFNAYLSLEIGKALYPQLCAGDFAFLEKGPQSLVDPVIRLHPFAAELSGQLGAHRLQGVGFGGIEIEDGVVGVEQQPGVYGFHVLLVTGITAECKGRGRRTSTRWKYFLSM